MARTRPGQPSSKMSSWEEPLGADQMLEEAVAMTADPYLSQNGINYRLIKELVIRRINVLSA